MVLGVWLCGPNLADGFSILLRRLARPVERPHISYIRGADPYVHRRKNRQAPSVADHGRHGLPRPGASCAGGKRCSILRASNDGVWVTRATFEVGAVDADGSSGNIRHLSPEFRRAAADSRATQCRFHLQLLTAMARRRRDDARGNPLSGVKPATPHGYERGVVAPEVLGKVKHKGLNLGRHWRSKRADSPWGD